MTAAAAIIAAENRLCARNYAPLEIVLARGEGAHVWDVAGKRYLDFMSAYSAVSLGHGHPRILRALREQSERLSVISRAAYSDRLAPFLEKLCAVSGFAKALPMNTGAEAV
ncbi:MAG TPA: aminotransferase class III-fold pyridoxal phosphate-dependent enzyme, partial [Rhizomicrobium sp.]